MGRRNKKYSINLHQSVYDRLRSIPHRNLTGESIRKRGDMIWIERYRYVCC